jgi:prepilin-type N-terminal cleavage/methylation domain-containing protein
MNMKRKGFTLIEVMIALGIFVLFSGYMYRTFFNQIRLYSSVNNKNHTQYSGRNAINIITDVIRKSDKIVKHVPTIVVKEPNLPNGSVEKIIAPDGTGKNRLLIDMNEDDSYVGDVNYSYIDKTLTDADDNVLCSEISSLIMRYDELTGVITINAEITSGKETYELVTGINIKE